MTGLGALIRRNSKLYFKDKGMFFTSLITPMILLVLYVTFLSRTYEGSFRSALAAAGAQVEDTLLHGCVGGQLISSLLAVSCVTVAFCSNLTMVFDKVSGARNDLTVSPVRPAVLSLSYYLATFCTTLLINGIAAAACFGYLALTGWYLSAADVLLVLLDVGGRGDPGAVRHGAVVLHDLPAFDERTGQRGRNDRERGVRLCLRGLYARFELLARAAEGHRLPAGDVWDHSAALPCDAGRVCGDAPHRLSGGGRFGHP